MSLQRLLVRISLPMLWMLAVQTSPTSAQEPTYGGGITVDGDPADWNLGADFFSELSNSGVVDPAWPGYAVLARCYLRYDCNQDRLSILVLDEAADAALPVADAARAWVKVYGQGWGDDLLIDGTGAGNTSPRGFAWVHQTTGDPLSPVIGYEAYAELPANAYASIEAQLGYDGALASTGKHVSGFDGGTFNAELEALNQTGSTRIRVQYPFNGGPAYFPSTEIDLDGDGTAELNIPSWCIDTDHTINQNTWYCTELVSSYNYPNGLDDTRWENLDVVNWILNQAFVGQSSGGFGTYTYGDVQLAIWSVIDNASAPNHLGSYDANRVDQILALAAVAVGLDDVAVTYEPPCDGVVGLILVPTDCGSSFGQFLVGQMLVSEYPNICTSYDLPLLILCDGITVGEVDQPNAFSLAPAQPNPFNPETVLTVVLPETGPASLRVFDVAGREVATLFDGLMAAGEQRVRFRAENLPSGVYVAVLESAGGLASQKLLLIK
ncbi:MAG: T9SS type A sorting domain-containing protein [Candidatus Delongbacteria bacterium]